MTQLCGGSWEGVTNEELKLDGARQRRVWLGVICVVGTVLLVFGVALVLRSGDRREPSSAESASCFALRDFRSEWDVASSSEPFARGFSTLICAERLALRIAVATSAFNGT